MDLSAYEAVPDWQSTNLSSLTPLSKRSAIINIQLISKLSNHHLTLFFGVFKMHLFEEKGQIIDYFVGLPSAIAARLLIQLIHNLLMQKKLKSTQQKTEDFFKTVEAGDISLFSLFDEAIAVFGFTKVGKTSSCHILANSPLRAELSNGDLIYRPATQKYSTATVGITPQSETEIPNIFETKFRDSKNQFKTVTILDQPGYGDTYGFHRIFSNGYFHYRTFSKTPNLKFILAFKKVDLEGTAQKFKNTIQYFINTFVRYDDIYKEILAATTFLITQADPRTNINNLRNIISNIRDAAVGSMTQQQKNRFQDMINHMLTNNKIFFIERPEQAGTQTRQCDILKQIYEKTTFWRRDVKKQVVDMKEINFSVAAQILAGLLSFKGKALFKEQFDHFMTFMQRRIDQILLKHEFSLKNIVQILKKDAVSSVEAHNFLQGMMKFVKTFYNFNEQFKDRRQKTQANLFNLHEAYDSFEQSRSGLFNNQVLKHQKEERQREMRQVYFIKKFKVLQFIKVRVDQIVQEAEIQRSVEWLEQMSSFFIEMFRRFNYLRVDKSDSQRIIYKYSYIVQRLIEQSKILTLILFSNPQARKKFDQYKENMVDIFRPLKDKLFTQFGQLMIGELKRQFISKLNFDKFEAVNKQIIKFFESISDLSEKALVRVAQLIIKYAQLIIDRKKNVKDDEKQFVAYKLFQYRNRFYAFLKNIIADPSSTKKEKQNCIQNIFMLSNALGKILSGFQLYQQARQVFKSTNNSDSVFKIFEAELKMLQNDHQKTRDLLLEYGKYAGQCHRDDLAMRCFQQAYAKSKSYEQFLEVKTHILKVTTINKGDEDDLYLKKFYNEEFCSEFSQNLKTKIRMLYEQDKEITPYLK